MLGWIVGATTSVILLLMILTVILVVCRGRLFTRRPLPILETASAAQSRNSSEKDKNKNEYSTSSGQNLSNVVLRSETNFYDTISTRHDVSLKL